MARSDVVRLLVETGQERLYEGRHQKSKKVFFPAFQMYARGKNQNETHKAQASTHPAVKPNQILWASLQQKAMVFKFACFVLDIPSHNEPN